MLSALKVFFELLFLDQHFGPLKYPPSVCQSVSPSVRQKFSYFPSLVFSDFLRQVSLFQMQKSDEARFSKKKCVSKLFSFLSPKQGFLADFGPFLANASLVLADISYFNRFEHSLHILLRQHARKKIRSPTFRSFRLQIRCFWQFFCHFLENSSLVLADISYFNRLEHPLQFLFRHHAQKKIWLPCFWPFCVQIMRFLCCFGIALF